MNKKDLKKLFDRGTNITPEKLAILIDNLGGGSGVEIVDSVSKLDPNAEVGSIASVVTLGSAQKTSLSNLPQADASIIDQTTYMLNASDCPLVKGLSVIVPTNTIPVATTINETQMIYFVSESVGLIGQSSGAIIGIMPLIQNGELSALMAVHMDAETQIHQNFTLFSITNGVVTTDQDAINQVNTLINGLHYIGSVEYVFQSQQLPAEVLAVYDMVVKVVSDVPSTAYMYIKGGEWAQLYKKDFDKLVSDLNTTNTIVKNKADKIPFAIYDPWQGLQPNVYTTYTINYPNSFTIKLASIADDTVCNEYILELKCISTPSNVVFNNADGTAATIVWANDIAPTFEAGMTYLISIVNGFGVYSIFPNS